ncbi:unnamed protein product [Closterium sp. Naga37s-1]|nr:unnamed protein product [Closterium sp. Naga37s-1]
MPCFTESLRQQRPVSAVTNSAPRASSVDRDGNPASARSGGPGPAIPPQRNSRGGSRFTDNFVESLLARLRAQDLELLDMRGKLVAGNQEKEQDERHDNSPKRQKTAHARGEREAPQSAPDEDPTYPENNDTFPFAQFSPFVHEVMQAQFQARYACHLPLNARMGGWARTLCCADMALPQMDKGWQEKVDTGVAYIRDELPDAETSFWPDDALMERAMAHSMEFTEKEDLSKLHLVLELDKKRSGYCTHAMQKFRSDVWLIVRAFFRILNGLKYTKPPTARIALAAAPDALVVTPKTDEEFTEKYAATSFSHDLMTWQCAEETPELPFSSESFDRGIYAAYKSSPKPPQVVKLYSVAFWLFGTEQPLLKKTVLKKSGPQNGTTVEWYHHRLKAWAKHAIIERTPEHGPWWKAKRKAWAFKRHALVLISDDGQFLAPLREAESRDE